MGVQNQAKMSSKCQNKHQVFENMLLPEYPINDIEKGFVLFLIFPIRFSNLFKNGKFSKKIANEMWDDLLLFSLQRSDAAVLIPAKQILHISSHEVQLSNTVRCRDTGLKCHIKSFK